VRFLSCGSRAVLVELDGLPQVLSLYASLRDDPLAGLSRLVPGARTVLVSYDPAVIDGEQVRAALSARPLSGVAAECSGSAVQIPVHYDGPDLAEVARLAGLPVAEVVSRHTAGEYLASFAGYAPGWCYLVGLDESLHLPRRASPRTRVPAGSVAVAGEFTGVYPGDAPGGWHLIGRTEATMWDVDREPPALLAVGARVRFVEAAQ